MPINEMPGCRIAAGAAARVRLRSAVMKAAALAIPAAALLGSAGVASAATTQHAARVAEHAVQHGARPASAANVTWHHLGLRNGWQAATGSGFPSYAVSNGVVYLTGGLKQPVAGIAEFAVLPKAARPSHAMYRSVMGFGAVQVTLIILPNGVMKVTNPASNAQQFSSLAGVSYPTAAGTTWHKISLINGWKSAANTGANTGDPAYAVKNGVVYLSGSVWQPSGSNTTFAVLPRAARPGVKMYLTDFMAADNRGALLIASTGAMLASSTPPSQAQGFTSLAAISYPARGTTWHPLTLVNGWTRFSRVTGTPAYTIKNGIVYLSGAVQETSGVSVIFANLPSAARPVHGLTMPTRTNGGSYGELAVGPHPRMVADSNPFSNAQSFASLSAISYPVNS